MTGPESGGEPESSGANDGNEYSKLGEGGQDAGEKPEPSASPEPPDLQAARERLQRIQSGAEVPPGGIHEGWEKAMTAVETEEAKARESGGEETRTGVEPGQSAGVDDESSAPESEVVAPTAYIGEVVLSKGVSGVADNKSSEKYRPLANEVVSKMLADPEYAKEVQSRDGVGTDVSDQGISEIMAIGALPYLRRAEKAEARGWHKRAAIYREEASDQANMLGRTITRSGKWDAAARAGLKVSFGMPSGELVDRKLPKEPRNFLGKRTIGERMGLSARALLRFK